MIIFALMDVITHKLLENTFDLLPEKAIYWQEKSCLLIADLHLGKATHFRKNGLAIPLGVENDNYDRLSHIILNNEVKTVYILGDLFHSEHNDQWNNFRRFLEKFVDIQFMLIMGNHDILDDKLYQIPNLKCSEDYKIGSFLFTHIPLEKEKIPKGLYNLSGHIHPAVKIKGKGRQTLRLACYYFSENQAILPAFGAFTGMHTIEIKKNDNVYVVSEETIVQMC